MTTGSSANGPYTKSGVAPSEQEPAPGLDQVDGRDIEEEADARRRVGQLTVDRQVARSQLAVLGHAMSVNTFTVRRAATPSASRSSLT